MAVPNTAPIFTSQLIVGQGQLTTANTDASGTTTANMVNVRTAPSTGAGERVDRIVITATGATVAGLVRLFVHDGTTAYPFKEVAVSNVTPSTTLAAFTAEVVRSDGLPVMQLPAGYSLKATTTITQNLQAVSLGGSY